MSQAVVVGSLVGGTLALLVPWVVSMVLRGRHPAVRHTLWRLGLIVFWLVPIAALTAHLVGVTQPVVVPAHRLSEEVPNFSSLETRAVRLPPLLLASFTWSRGGTPYGAIPIGLGILIALWVTVGVMVWLVRRRGEAALWRVLRRAEPCEDPDVLTLAESVHAELGMVGGVWVKMSPDACIPFALANLEHRWIVLPADFDPQAPGAASVLAHEMTHLQRGDPLTDRLARLTSTLAWWHPLVHLAGRHLRRTAEEAADDEALSLASSPDGYAAELLRYAEQAVGADRHAASYRGGILSARVRRILAAGVRRATPLSTASMLLTFAGLAAVCIAAGVHDFSTPGYS
ncbi:MAG: hypothetical protein GF320_18550, partial [Armatimonadia bacterium]|nr:hypothetical protein [Armatimonadia bacterium]